MVEQLNELSFYTLAGAPKSPAELLAEVRQAEEVGLGSAFISERFNVKEALTLCGAAAGATTTLGIATGVTNHNTRHPMVTASHATTMHHLTGGRYALGLGRGIVAMQRAYGLKPITTAQLEDFAGLMRRLWRGEPVVGHDGPSGSWPFLMIDPELHDDIPLALTTFGPESLKLCGRAFDASILHTFFTDETLVRCVGTIRSAAEQAGRDPASIRVWSCLATVHDGIPEPLRLKKTVGRMSTYLQAYGDLMVSTNRWDPAALQRFREDPLVAGFQGAIDQKATTEQLEHIATLIPEEWLAPMAAGTPEQCAAEVLRQLDLGADGVILHGATPSELEPVVAAYRRIRPPGRFDRLRANPAAPPAP